MEMVVLCHRRQQRWARGAVRVGAAQNGGNVPFLQSQQTIAGQQDLIPRLERVDLARQVHQLQFRARDCADQGVTVRMTGGFGSADLAAADLMRQDAAIGVILIQPDQSPPPPEP